MSAVTQYVRLSAAADYANDRNAQTPRLSDIDIIMAGAGGEINVYWRNSMQRPTQLETFDGKVPDSEVFVRFLPVSKHDLGRLETTPQIEGCWFDPTPEEWRIVEKLGATDGWRWEVDEKPLIVSRDLLFVRQDDLIEWIATMTPQNADTPPALRTQEQAILAKLKELGYDPKALPPVKNGKPGVRAECRKALKDSPLFEGSTTFNKAWERLSQFDEIAYTKAD